MLSHKMEHTENKYIESCFAYSQFQSSQAIRE